MEKLSKKIRVKFLGKPIEQEVPFLLRLLLAHYSEYCKGRNLCQISYSVDDLPLSLNHNKFRRLKKTKTGKVVPFDVLKPEVLKYRELTHWALKAKNVKWNPIGTTSAIIMFESPIWITKELRVRKQDADNRVKPVFDAIEHATGVPDELHWNFHVFKVPSKRTRTIVWLFDNGDVVDYYG